MDKNDTSNITVSAVIYNKLNEAYDFVYALSLCGVDRLPVWKCASKLLDFQNDNHVNQIAELEIDDCTIDEMDAEDIANMTWDRFCEMFGK
jgi:hypothetical protein